MCVATTPSHISIEDGERIADLAPLRPTAAATRRAAPAEMAEFDDDALGSDDELQEELRRTARAAAAASTGTLGFAPTAADNALDLNLKLQRTLETQLKTVERALELNKRARLAAIDADKMAAQIARPPANSKLDGARLRARQTRASVVDPADPRGEIPPLLLTTARPGAGGRSGAGTSGGGGGNFAGTSGEPSAAAERHRRNPARQSSTDRAVAAATAAIGHVIAVNEEGLPAGGRGDADVLSEDDYVVLGEVEASAVEDGDVEGAAPPARLRCPPSEDARRRDALAAAIPLRPVSDRVSLPWRLQERKDLREGAVRQMFDSAKREADARLLGRPSPDDRRQIDNFLEWLREAHGQYGRDAAQDDIIIRQLAAQWVPDDNTWQTLSRIHVPTRTATECQVQWEQRDDPLLRPFLTFYAPATASAAAAAATTDGQGATDGGATVTTARHVPWEEEELAALRAAVEAHGVNDWEAVAADLERDGFSGRTPMGCHRGYKVCLEPNDRPEPEMWSAEEDRKLKHAWVLELGNDLKWSNIARHLPGKTAKQCSMRWLLVSNPMIHKGAYTHEEDRIIADMVDLHGEAAFATWVPQVLPHRTSKSVGERWFVRLKPGVREGGPWTEAEDEALRSGVSALGAGNWKQISEREGLEMRSKREVLKRWQILSGADRGGGRTEKRCRACAGCLWPTNCGECAICLQKREFGGPGSKKCCKRRECTNAKRRVGALAGLPSQEELAAAQAAAERLTNPTHEDLVMRLLGPDAVPADWSLAARKDRRRAANGNAAAPNGDGDADGDGDANSDDPESGDDADAPTAEAPTAAGGVTRKKKAYGGWRIVYLPTGSKFYALHAAAAAVQGIVNGELPPPPPPMRPPPPRPRLHAPIEPPPPKLPLYFRKFSMTWVIHRALCAGNCDRDSLTLYVKARFRVKKGRSRALVPAEAAEPDGEDGEAVETAEGLAVGVPPKRRFVMNGLRYEMRKAEPLWQRAPDADAETFELTAKGEAMRPTNEQKEADDAELLRRMGVDSEEALYELLVEADKRGAPDEPPEAEAMDVNELVGGDVDHAGAVNPDAAVALPIIQTTVIDTANPNARDGAVGADDATAALPTAPAVFDGWREGWIAQQQQWQQPAEAANAADSSSANEAGQPTDGRHGLRRGRSAGPAPVLGLGDAGTDDPNATNAAGSARVVQATPAAGGSAPAPRGRRTRGGAGQKRMRGI